MGTGEGTGRHRGSQQAGPDALSAHVLGIMLLALCLGSMKGVVGHWRKGRKKELRGQVEARKYDLVGKLEKARIHGQIASHSTGLSLAVQPLPVLHLAESSRTGHPPWDASLTGHLV